MKLRLPDSIVSRTVLILLLGLTLSHAASTVVYYSDRLDAVAIVGEGRSAERIASITRLMDDAAPKERARILDAVSSAGLRVSLDPASAVSPSEGGGWHARLVEQVIRFHLGHRGDHPVRVQYPDAGSLGPRRMPPGSMMTMMMTDPSRAMPLHMRRMMADLAMGRGVRVSVGLSDGNWLNFVVPVDRPETFWSLRFVLSMALMALAVVAFSVWAAGRLVRPIRAFAAAAERIGRDIRAPQLPEEGPREVRQAVRAFNEMQRRIRRFVEDHTQMIAAISHDLRTPITRLRLRAEFVEDDEQRRKMLTDLDEMEHMIAATLRFARDEVSEEPREVVDLAALIQSACDDLSDGGADVACRGAGRLPFTCRPSAMRRAFTNLIENAVKYGARARVSVEATEGAVVVRIDDDGPGIPEEERENVFAPFYRIERSRSRDTGGTGLGLAFARNVIRAHGGDIDLANRKGGGLRVTVTLPR